MWQFVERRFSKFGAWESNGASLGAGFDSSPRRVVCLIESTLLSGKASGKRRKPCHEARQSLNGTFIEENLEMLFPWDYHLRSLVALMPLRFPVGSDA